MIPPPGKYPTSSEGSEVLLHVIGIHTFSIKEIMAFLKLKDREVNMINNVDSYTIPIIYQSGYLTIKSYDERFRNTICAFPTKRWKKVFRTSSYPNIVLLVNILTIRLCNQCNNIVLIHK